MALTDEEFREEYKPLPIPAHYQEADTLQNKVIFALAEISEGNEDDVIGELKKLEQGIIDDEMIAFTRSLLKALFEKGKINGNERDGVVYYNLHKITRQNSGSTHPDHKGVN